MTGLRISLRINKWFMLKNCLALFGFSSVVKLFGSVGFSSVVK